MKKQILFTIIGFIASITVAFSQTTPPDLTGAPTCPVPIAVTCLTADQLHPIPGTDYDYEVDVPTPITGTKTYNWFVTQDQDFIQNSVLTGNIELNDGSGAHIQATGTGYNNTTTGTNTINITWKSFTHDALNPVFLVIYVQNDQCQTDNIQVYIIQPNHAFTLDIANIGIDGAAHPDLYETCVAAVAGAHYNTTSGIVEMDYGINYMFFAVSAANYTDSWQPSFLLGGAGLTGAGVTRAVTAVEWATPTEAVAGTWHATTGSGLNWTAAGATLDHVTASGGTGAAVGPDGECIVIRITIANNQSQTIANAPISLAVDGVMLDPVNSNYTNPLFGDIHYAANPVGNVCPWYDGFTNDVITQVLAPRPDVQAVDPTPFTPNNASN